MSQAETGKLFLIALVIVGVVLELTYIIVHKVRTKKYKELLSKPPIYIYI